MGRMAMAPVGIVVAVDPGITTLRLGRNKALAVVGTTNIRRNTAANVAAVYHAAVAAVVEVGEAVAVDGAAGLRQTGVMAAVVVVVVHRCIGADVEAAAEVGTMRHRMPMEVSFVIIDLLS